MDSSNPGGGCYCRWLVETAARPIAIVPVVTTYEPSKVVGVGDGMIGKAIDGEGEALLYVLKLTTEGGNLG